MIRTLLFVLVLVWLLVASAIPFVPIVGGQEPLSGSLTATCDRDSVPRGVDTLLRCRYVATNTSGGVWANPRLFYAPATDVTIPDRYFFFRYKLNGVEQPHMGTEIQYAFGPLVDGASATIDLEIIVRSERDFGAAALLMVDQAVEIARAEQRWDVSDGAPEPVLYGSLVPIWRDESGGRSPSDASFTLVVRNTLGEDLNQVWAEVFAPDFGVTLGLDAGGRSSATAIAGTIGPAIAGGFIQRELRVETRGQCAYATPAMLLSAVTQAGATVSGVILPENGAPLNCQTLETPSFPAAGQGPMPEGAATPLRPLPLSLFACGVVLALLGVEPLLRLVRGR